MWCNGPTLEDMVVAQSVKSEAALPAAACLPNN